MESDEVWTGKYQGIGRRIVVGRERGKRLVFWTHYEGHCQNCGHALTDWDLKLVYRETRSNGVITKGWYCEKAGWETSGSCLVAENSGNGSSAP